jgi:hypothetical protein
VPRIGKLAHIAPDLGQNRLCGDHIHSGKRAQARDHIPVIGRELTDA